MAIKFTDVHATPTLPTKIPATNAGTPYGYVTIDDIKGFSLVKSVNGQTGDVSLSPVDLGLGDVDNTSDLDKPVSSAVQAALNTKSPFLTDLGSGASLISNSANGIIKKLVAGNNIYLVPSLDFVTISAGGGIWGSISGDISNQPDLFAVLNEKIEAVSLSVPTGFVAGPPVLSGSGGLSFSYAAGYKGYTTNEAAKLAAIESGAQANVKSDWNASSGWEEILNKPNLQDLAFKDKVGIVDIDAFGTPDASTYLRGDGVWMGIPTGGIGSVSSVGISVPTGFQVSNSPITSAGTMGITYSAGYQGYTVAESSKLAGIQTGADVTNATNVASAGAIMDSDFSANGIMTRVGAGAYASRTLVGTANEIIVSNEAGIAGNPTFSLATAAINSLNLANTALQYEDLGDIERMKTIYYSN